MNQRHFAGILTLVPALAAAAPCCPVIELRQYEMHAGQRDTLISLFEDKFIEGQEDVGIRVLGQFRDVRDADRFTWIRGFSSMEVRKQALSDFYYGALWQANRDAANATLKDNDNVLLLRPASPNGGFTLHGKARPARDAAAEGAFVVATIYYFDREPEARFIHYFEREMMPLHAQAGARVIGRFVSEKSRNTFERLPVREADNVFVWFSTFADRPAYERYLLALDADPRWRETHAPYLRDAIIRVPETLLLQATARSQIR